MVMDEAGDVGGAGKDGSRESTSWWRKVLPENRAPKETYAPRLQLKQMALWTQGNIYRVYQSMDTGMNTDI